MIALPPREIEQIEPKARRRTDPDADDCMFILFHFRPFFTCRTALP
jgi:hypothetical protein